MADAQAVRKHESGSYTRYVSLVPSSEIYSPVFAVLPKASSCLDHLEQERL